MRILLLIMGAIFLSGCGIESDDTTAQGSEDYLVSPPWNGLYQERNSEFYVQYSPKNPKRPMLPEIVDWWNWLKACTGFDVSIEHAPLVIEYVDLDSLDTSRDIRGLIWKELSYTVIVAHDVYRGDFTRHEMLHYLLYQVGESSYDNHNHTSTFWDSCNGSRYGW